MEDPILATKLYVPRPRAGAVVRTRLMAMLDEGRQRKLTLVSAPAGFGKTTLVAQWVAARDLPVGWLQLDAGDSDPARFLAYTIAALQTVVPGLGASAAAALQSAQPPPAAAVLTLLLNALAAVPEPLDLVLDDYHLASAPPIADILSFLLAHLPPQMHLILLTREDPQLPLARLRAQDELTDLRVRDLRFRDEEVGAFLNDVMDLTLTPAQVSALGRRTEGWVAGLQLAAISMRDRTDTAAFIDAFAGDHRYIVDYLAEEVLKRQPEAMRRFLLQTSILTRLSGELCEAVTGIEDGQSLLMALERQNLFLVPLDDQRRWYRYHHLFADLLRARAMQQSEALALPTLHARASAWFEAHQSPVDAICHALSAGDTERMADLLERAWPGMEHRYEVGLWLGLARALPRDVVARRPVLSVILARALVQRGVLEGVDDLLDGATRWLDDGLPDEGPAEAGGVAPVVIDRDQARALPALIAATRAYRALAGRDVAATVAHGRRALDLVPADDVARRGSMAALLSMAYVAMGALDQGYEVLSAGIADLRRAGQVLPSLRGTYVLADIAVAQGRLRDAIAIYQDALSVAETHGPEVLRGTADLHLRLSDLYHEQGNLEAAAAIEARAAALGEADASLHWLFRLRLAQARIELRRQNRDACLARLQAAAALQIPTPVPDLQPIPAMQARVWIAQGRLEAADRWAQDRGLTADDSVSYLHEYEHITLARLWLAHTRADGNVARLGEVRALLARLQGAAQAGGRWGSVIEISVLAALIEDAGGDQEAALDALARALTLGGPEGYRRIFLDEGAPMARLLEAAVARGIEPETARGLLTAASTADGAPPAQPLVEPLTERELEVLALVAEGLSNREIAERLFLAIPTVKGHNRNLYGKLGVRRRTEAVARARELGLL